MPSSPRTLLVGRVCLRAATRERETSGSQDGWRRRKKVLVLTGNPEKLGGPVLSGNDVEYDAAEGDVNDTRHEHGRQHDQDILRDKGRLLARVLGRGDSDTVTEALHWTARKKKKGLVSEIMRSPRLANPPPPLTLTAAARRSFGGGGEFAGVGGRGERNNVLATATTMTSHIHALCRNICQLCTTRTTAYNAVEATAAPTTGV